MPPRLIRITDGRRLDPDDECYYIDEYQARAGFAASEANQLISNLKADLVDNPKRSYWKTRAIQQAAWRLSQVLSAEALRTQVTIIPLPCSKPIGHPHYDDRLNLVLRSVGTRVGSGFDLRPMIVTTRERDAQHHSDDRASVAELLETMALDGRQLTQPLRNEIIVFDDVFTLGTTFKAAQVLLREIPGITLVRGVFLARTVWPADDPAADFDSLHLDSP